MAVPVLRPLETGEVLDVSFGLYRALFFPLVIVAAVSRTLPLLLNLYLQPTSTEPMANYSMMVERWPLWLLWLGLTMLATAFAVASTTSIVSAAYLGEAVAPDVALLRATGVIGRLIVVSLLTSIAVALGFIVLVVPGLVLLSGLALSSVALVLEPGMGPVEAMSRSWALTSGSRGKVFITLFVAWLFLFVPTFVVGLIAAIGMMVGQWPVLVSAIMTGILQIFAVPFMYVVVTVLYYDLRVRKEGYDLELLAAAATQSAG